MVRGLFPEVTPISPKNTTLTFHSDAALGGALFSGISTPETVHEVRNVVSWFIGGTFGIVLPLPLTLVLIRSNEEIPERLRHVLYKFVGVTYFALLSTSYVAMFTGSTLWPLRILGCTFLYSLFLSVGFYLYLVRRQQRASDDPHESTDNGHADRAILDAVCVNADATPQATKRQTTKTS